MCSWIYVIESDNSSREFPRAEERIPVEMGENIKFHKNI